MLFRRFRLAILGLFASGLALAAPAAADFVAATQGPASLHICKE